MAKIVPLENSVKFFKRVLSDFNRNRALRKAGKALTKKAARRINLGKDAYGNKFIPNSPMTVALKGSNKPLIDRGIMRRAYFYKIKNKTLIIGNRQPYAINHQLGGEVINGQLVNKIPQRIVLDALVDSEDVIDSYRSIVKDAISFFGG